MEKYQRQKIPFMTIFSHVRLQTVECKGSVVFFYFLFIQTFNEINSAVKGTFAIFRQFYTTKKNTKTYLL